MTSQPTPAELTFTVPGVSCANCQAAIVDEVSRVPRVSAVDVDLETKVVTVRGAGIDDQTVLAAIETAGYDVER
ncbi:MAG: heavy-metal-associated domain-containing protein [Thermoleophilaceae bacterium]|nr:heavy-metal-associated domain-containing protein [Thermoleophilaceae bacterium]